MIPRPSRGKYASQQCSLCFCTSPSHCKLSNIQAHTLRVSADSNRWKSFELEGSADFSLSTGGIYGEEKQLYRFTRIRTTRVEKDRATSFIFIHQAGILEMSYESSFPLDPSICKWCHLFTVELLPFLTIKWLHKFSFIRYCLGKGKQELTKLYYSHQSLWRKTIIEVQLQKQK